MVTERRSPQSVRVRVPATSANLGPGFDTLGVALDWTAEIVLTAGEEHAPSPDGATAAIEGMATIAARTAFEEAGQVAPPISARYHGDLPVGRGLGMSAASRAAGLVGGNALLEALGGTRCSDEAVIEAAVRLEGHGDNIIPALFGGVQVVVQPDGAPVQHVRLEPPDDLVLALLIPEFSMPTEESRRRLPVQLTRAEAVHNISRAALVVAALAERRYDVLRTAVRDVLHQPVRGELFPALFPIIEGAEAAGAYGGYLSGGGSTVAAFCDPAVADTVASRMLDVAREHQLEATARVVRLRATGTEVVGS